MGYPAKHLLIVEDQSGDLRLVAQLAESIGISHIEARTSASAARLYLESALEGKNPLPDIIILDLDLGYESGFELLRFWHSNPGISTVRMIVWTGLGEEQREICALFKVSAVVPKFEGVGALQKAIESYVSTAS